MSAKFLRKLFELVNAVLIPFGDLILDIFTRKLPTNTAEIRAVLLAALEYLAFVLPHLYAFAVCFAATGAAAVVEKSACFAVTATRSYS